VNGLRREHASPAAGDESGSIASLGSFGRIASLVSSGSIASIGSLWSALTAFLLLALVSSPPRGR
jgi:hypothetical protein